MPRSISLWRALAPALASPAFALALPGPPAAAGATRLDAVQVTTRRPEDGRVRAEAVARLDAATLDRLAPTHANEALARVPGAWASRGSGQEQLLALRSPVLTGPGACGAFLVLDDGVPIRPAGFCNVNQLSEVNLAQAEGVEVLRGPGSAVHGSNALHGVVAVRPRLPGEGGSVRGEFGSDDYRRVLLALDDGARFRVDANAVDTGSFRADEGYAQQQLTAQWQPALEGSTRFAFAAHRLRQETAGFAFGEGAWRDGRRSGNANPEAFREADSARLALHHVRAVGDGELLLRPYARDESQTFLQHFNLGQPLEANGSRSLGLQAMWSDATLRIGLDVEGVEGELRQTQARALTTGTPAQNAQRPAGIHYDYAIDARQLALFGEKQWRLDRDVLTLGARIERLHYAYDNRAGDGNRRDDGTPAASAAACTCARPIAATPSPHAARSSAGCARSTAAGRSVPAPRTRSASRRPPSCTACSVGRPSRASASRRPTASRRRCASPEGPCAPTPRPTPCASATCCCATPPA